MIDKDIKKLIRLEIDLRRIRFVVSTRKDGTVKVKIGKKIDLITVPDENWGKNISDELTAVITKKADFVSDAIECMIERMEKLELDLFGKQESLNIGEDNNGTT